MSAGSWAPERCTSDVQPVLGSFARSDVRGTFNLDPTKLACQVIITLYMTS